jgi:hypothetical protein
MLQDFIAHAAGMGPQHLLALGIFASYFALILWLFNRVLGSIQVASSSQNQNERKGFLIHLFWALTTASFAHTWFCEY